LTNNLTGVLCRFRQELIAFICDIEAMFHQVRLNEEHRDLLRFLWWEDGDLTKEPKEYRMTLHLFRATSSPGCANFALKATANDFEREFGTTAAEFLQNDFYVDDGLKSVSSVEEAIDMVHTDLRPFFSSTFQGLFKDKSHFFEDLFSTQFDIHVINPSIQMTFYMGCSAKYVVLV